MSFIIWSIQPTGRYTYEATISDEANFNEIMNRFDIIDKHGEIYSLQDKVTDE